MSGESQPDDRLFVKTPKGIEEVEQKIHGLALKARQVLIMIDGKRDRAALQSIFPPEMVPSILGELIDGGFIRPLDRPKPKPVVQAEVGEEEDPFLLAQTFMVNIAKRVLGIAADGIIAKLKAAKTPEDLRGLFAEWRRALTQAPDGLARIKEFETKLFKVLGEVTTSAASPVAGGAPTTPPKRPSNDQERLEMARNFMSNSAKTYLGIVADPLVAKLRNLNSIEELRHHFFEWREMLKQSPESKRRLGELEAKLAALLS